MKSKPIIDYIAHFREKAEMRKLIIFVGSGVSCNVEGMPSWYSLIRSMAHAIGYSKCDGCKHKTDNCKSTCAFIEDYSSDEFLKISQYVYNSSKKLYDCVLKESLFVSNMKLLFRMETCSHQKRVSISSRCMGLEGSRYHSP